MRITLLILSGVSMLAGCGTPPKPVTMAPSVEAKMLQKVAAAFDSDFRLQAGGSEPQIPPAYKSAEITGPYQGFHEFTAGTMYCIRAVVSGRLFGGGATGLVLLTPGTNGHPDSFNFKLIRKLGNQQISGCRDTEYRPFPELIEVRENRIKNFDPEAELKAFHSRPRSPGRPDRF